MASSLSFDELLERFKSKIAFGLFIFFELPLNSCLIIIFPVLKVVQFILYKTLNFINIQYSIGTDLRKFLFKK